MRIGKQEIIVLGDRLLVLPDQGEERTKVGLYLPQTVTDNEAVLSGRVTAQGPGLPVPEPGDQDEPWKMSGQTVKHIPMQVTVGDRVIFLRKSSVELKIEGQTYLVIPQAAVLVVFREDFRLKE